VVCKREEDQMRTHEERKLEMRSNVERYFEGSITVDEFYLLLAVLVSEEERSRSDKN
jgi:hypothetical protein